MLGFINLLISGGALAKDFVKDSTFDTNSRSEAAKKGNATYMDHKGTMRCTASGGRYVEFTRNGSMDNDEVAMDAKTGQIYRNYSAERRAYKSSRVREMEERNRTFLNEAKAEHRYYYKKRFFDPYKYGRVVNYFSDYEDGRDFDKYVEDKYVYLLSNSDREVVLDLGKGFPICLCDAEYRNIIVAPKDRRTLKEMMTEELRFKFQIIDSKRLLYNTTIWDTIRLIKSGKLSMDIIKKCNATLKFIPHDGKIEVYGGNGMPHNPVITLKESDIRGYVLDNDPMDEEFRIAQMEIENEKEVH